MISRYEKLLLLGGSLTFFWGPAIFDTFLVLSKKSANDAGKTGWMGLSLRLAGFAAISSALLFLLLGSLVILPEEPFSLIFAFAIYTGAESLSLLLVYHFLLRNESKWIWLLALAGNAAYFLAIILSVSHTGDLIVGAWALMAIAGIKVFWLVARFVKPGSDQEKGKKAFRRMWQIGAPIGLSMLLSRSAEFVDGYLVLNYFQEEFATFRYGAKELPFILLMANALSVVKSGEIAGAGKSVKDAVSGLRAGAGRLMLWLFPASFLLLIFSQPLFELVFNGEFTDAHIVFDVYLLLVIPRLIFPQSVLKGKMETKMLAWSAGAELILNVGLSLFFMQFWGLAGIAMATFISYFVEKLILVIYLQAREKISFSAYTPILIWSFFSLALTGLYLLKVLWLDFFPSKELFDFF